MYALYAFKTRKLGKGYGRGLLFNLLLTISIFLQARILLRIHCVV